MFLYKFCDKFKKTYCNNKKNAQIVYCDKRFMHDFGY